MKRLYRLEDKDMLEIDHFPVNAIFNMITDKEFITKIENISQGIGFGVDSGACLFLDNLDEFDRKFYGTFEGVEFGLYNGESIIIDYKTLYYYLKKICEGYIDDFPKAKKKVEDILFNYKINYNID